MFSSSRISVSGTSNTYFISTNTRIALLRIPFNMPCACLSSSVYALH